MIDFQALHRYAPTSKSWVSWTKADAKDINRIFGSVKYKEKIEEVTNAAGKRTKQLIMVPL